MEQEMPELHRLWQSYWKDEIEEAELQRLLQLLDNAGTAHKEALLQQSWEELEEPILVFSAEEKVQQLQTLLSKLQESRNIHIPLYRKRTFWWAAASIILLTGIALVMLNQSGFEKNTKNMALSDLSSIPPASSGAILVMSDGRSVNVDSAHASILTETGQTLTDAGHGLDYSNQRNNVGQQIPVHELRTARSMKYSFLLPDGTRVWLNAASRLRFPTQFISERWIELEGEACLDVTPQTKPFLVKLITPALEGTVVQVLGTHFNVEAYEGDPAMKATLLEGKIAVENATQKQILLPGQQARVAASNNNSITIHTVNTSQAIAWTKDLFQFEEDDLQTVMKQIARWYGVDIVYKGSIPPMRFKGKIQRNLSLGQMLELLEADIDYQLTGKQLLITPKKVPMNH